MLEHPIIPTKLDNKLCRGDVNDFAEMCAWDDNARQLRKVADLLAELAADCVIERRQGLALEDHAYCRIRADGHYDLSHELMAMVARLAEQEATARNRCNEAKAEYEFGRQSSARGVE